MPHINSAAAPGCAFQRRLVLVHLVEEYVLGVASSWSTLEAAAAAVVLLERARPCSMAARNRRAPPLEGTFTRSRDGSARRA